MEPSRRGVRDMDASQVLMGHGWPVGPSKCLCRGDLVFLKHKMDGFTDHEIETVLALGLGL